MLVPAQSETTINGDISYSITGLFDPAYYELGISIGDTHTLEIHYITSDLTHLEIGSKMHYFVSDITADTCTFLETVNSANGSLVDENNYTDSRGDIQMPLFYTTINVTLLSETLNSSEYTVTADANYIMIQQYSGSSGDITEGEYIFHRNTGWLYSFVATFTESGEIVTEIDMKDINYVFETTTTEPGTTEPVTSEPAESSTTIISTEDNTTSKTTTKEESISDDDSTESTKETTTIPEISPISGFVSMIVLVTLSLVYRRKKANLLR